MKNDSNIAEIKKAVKAALPDQRWAHTEGVVRESVRLAGKYGADVQKAELAAVLHDYVKYWPTARLEEVLRNESEVGGLLEHDKQLWHAPAGAIMAAKDFGIRDQEVLDAIAYHTSGRPGMSKLEKVVCLADYIEPGRDFPGVERIRELAEESLEKALTAGFDSTLTFLIQNGKKIFPLSVLTRNALIEEWNQG